MGKQNAMQVNAMQCSGNTRQYSCSGEKCKMENKPRVQKVQRVERVEKVERVVEPSPLEVQPLPGLASILYKNTKIQ